MNIREAILKAADQIERAPSDYNFGQISVPPSDGGCGTPACMLGWIGMFAGVRSGTLVNKACRQTLGMEPEEFYDRIRALSKDGVCASLSTEEIPSVLRAYADKYHQAECRDLIPSSVRDIFTMTPEQLGREFAKI